MINPGYQSIQHEEHHHEKEEEEPKVSTLELFSDLVIVVSIHVVAEPMEEPEFDQFVLYFARVFYLWMVWHMVTLIMNAAVKMKNSNCPIHTFFIFIWMAAILNMARSFAVDEDSTAVKWYLGLRAFESLVYYRQIHFPYKAISMEDGTALMSVSDEWYTAMRMYTPIMFFTLLFCEILPLALAVYWGNGYSLYIPMVITSMILIVFSFFLGAMGAISNGGKMLVNAFDSDHLQERYELITLIFTGELCFAAGKPGNSVGSNGVMIMAFVAYLLTFKANPLKGQIKFWARSVVHSVSGLFLYAGVFCAIPAMGSAFARIIAGGEEKRTEEEEVEEPKVSAGDLLCYSAGAFMIFSATINLICIDPSGPMAPKISSFNRGVIRMLSGLSIWSLIFLIPEHLRYKGAPLTTVLVPTIAMLCTIVEIRAVGSLQLFLNK